LDSFMWGSYPASLRNVGGSTRVPVRAWSNAQKRTWGLPPPVKLERRQMTYTVSVWRKTQSNKCFDILYFLLSVFDKVNNMLANADTPIKVEEAKVSVCSVWNIYYLINVWNKREKWIVNK
jgi:hypothetical protein